MQLSSAKLCESPFSWDFDLIRGLSKVWARHSTTQEHLCSWIPTAGALDGSASSAGGSCAVGRWWHKIWKLQCTHSSSWLLIFTNQGWSRPSVHMEADNSFWKTFLEGWTGMVGSEQSPRAETWIRSQITKIHWPHARYRNNPKISTGSISSSSCHGQVSCQNKTELYFPYNFHSTTVLDGDRTIVSSLILQAVLLKSFFFSSTYVATCKPMNPTSTHMGSSSKSTTSCVKASCRTARASGRDNAAYEFEHMPQQLLQEAHSPGSMW